MIYPGIDYIGFDLPSSVMGQTLAYPTEDPTVCCALCSNNTACNSWTSVRGGASYGCYLKFASQAQLNNSIIACESCSSG
jgi:hypothetical protein